MRHTYANSLRHVAMSASIGIMGSLAVPVVAYLAYIIVRARKGAVPKNWWEAPQ